MTADDGAARRTGIPQIGSGWRQSIPPPAPGHVPTLDLSMKLDVIEIDDVLFAGEAGKGSRSLVGRIEGAPQQTVCGHN